MKQRVDSGEAELDSRLYDVHKRLFTADQTNTASRRDAVFNLKAKIDKYLQVNPTGPVAVFRGWALTV